MSCRPEERVQHPHGRERVPEEWERLRKRALAMVEEDWPVREVARTLEVSEGTISKWRQRAREKGEAAGPSPRQRHHGPCREYGCPRGCASARGYCKRHLELRVRRGHQPRPPPAAPSPCANAPTCTRQTGKGGAKGLCSACYQRQRRAELSAQEAA